VDARPRLDLDQRFRITATPPERVCIWQRDRPNSPRHGMHSEADIDHERSRRPALVAGLGPVFASAADPKRRSQQPIAADCAEMNTNVGWLMYFRHDQGDSRFSSCNQMNPTPRALDGRFGRDRVPVI
jgi:hypothetical protein